MYYCKKSQEIKVAIFFILSPIKDLLNISFKKMFYFNRSIIIIIMFHLNIFGNYTLLLLYFVLSFIGLLGSIWLCGEKKQTFVLVIRGIFVNSHLTRFDATFLMISIQTVIHIAFLFPPCNMSGPCLASPTVSIQNLT